MVSDTVCCPVASLTRPPQPTASCPAEHWVLNSPVPADGTVLRLAEAAGRVGPVAPFEPVTCWQAANINGTPTNASRRHGLTPTQTNAAVKSYKLAGFRLRQRVAQTGGVVAKQPLEEQDQ